MKSRITTLFFLLMTCYLFGQDNIGIGILIPNAQAVLDITSSDKGILIPRLTGTQRMNMSLGMTEEGMMVYDLTTQNYQYFDGTDWKEISTSSGLWNTTGGNVWYTGGNIGIGTNNPGLARLQVVTPLVNITGRFANNFTSDIEDSYALYAINTANGAHERHGVYGAAKGSPGGIKLYGMYGHADPDNESMDAYGGFFWTKNTGTGVHYGVYAQAQGAGNYGIYAKNTTTTGYAGYFEGESFFSDKLNISDQILIKPTGHAGGGEIELYDDDGDQNITIRANQNSTNGAEMLMYNDASELTLELDADFNGGNSRIITDELQIKGGADLAENFHVSSTTMEIVPGMVVSIDDQLEGGLKATDKAYDHKVVGVISGANGISPGMLMGQEGSIADGDYPIALTGRVYVLADASTHAIHPGDFLTSSSEQGFAMRAKNKKKANGATIGKALTALSTGKGYVLMLVNLK